MRAARAPRRSIREAFDFFALSPSIQALGAEFVLRGYGLAPKARVYRRADGSYTARLVWRHRSIDSSIVLTVRL